MAEQRRRLLTKVYATRLADLHTKIIGGLDNERSLPVNHPNCREDC